jgi:hypothetical protein
MTINISSKCLETINKCGITLNGAYHRVKESLQEYLHG